MRLKVNVYILSIFFSCLSIVSGQAVEREDLLYQEFSALYPFNLPQRQQHDISKHEVFRQENVHSIEVRKPSGSPDKLPSINELLASSYHNGLNDEEVYLAPLRLSSMPKETFFSSSLIPEKVKGEQARKWEFLQITAKELSVPPKKGTYFAINRPLGLQEEKRKKNCSCLKNISQEEMGAVLHLKQAEAAEKLNVSISTLRRCFQKYYAGQSWPKNYKRKNASLRHR